MGAAISHPESTTENLARLIAELSDQDLLRGDPSDLLLKAQADPTYGRGFRDEPYLSRRNGGNINFALFHHTKFVLLIFPGSKLLLNWASRTGNFSFRRTRKLGGKVHKGFWKQVDSFWAELARELNRVPGLPVVFGGHSRGGACAVIAALRVEQQYELRRVAAVITLGQPGCVNLRLARRIRRDWGPRYVRIVTSTDVIPLAPSWPWYTHAGAMWFYKTDGTRTDDPRKDDIEEAIREDNPLMARHQNLIRFGISMWRQTQVVVDGHALATYRACLSADAAPAV